jgi:hypothetical protein
VPDVWITDSQILLIRRVISGYTLAIERKLAAIHKVKKQPGKENRSYGERVKERLGTGHGEGE